MVFLSQLLGLIILSHSTSSVLDRLNLCLDTDPPKVGQKFVCANVGKTGVATPAQGQLPNAAAEEDPILQRLTAVVERRIRKRPFVYGIHAVQSTAGTSKRRRLSDS